MDVFIDTKSYIGLWEIILSCHGLWGGLGNVGILRKSLIFSQVLSVSLSSFFGGKLNSEKLEIFTKKNDENSIKKLNLQDAKEIFLRVYKPTMFSCSIDKQPKELQFQKKLKREVPVNGKRPNARHRSA